MRPNPQFRADLITFTEESLNEKLNFLCIDESKVHSALYQEFFIFYATFSLSGNNAVNNVYIFLVQIIFYRLVWMWNMPA